MKRIVEADKCIRDYIRETPVEFSLPLSKIGRCQVHLKLENLQITGSFKFRGAINKILSLTKKEVVTASSGNHGLAVAKALSLVDGTGLIFLPQNTVQAKIDALQEFDVEVKIYGEDSSDTELHARQIANQEEKTYISPYNDWDIIAGQGTIGIELEKQLPHIDSVLVAIGGGGLISGVGTYLKDVNPKVEVIGCTPLNSPPLYESIKAGRIVNVPIHPTLSDGTAGGIEPNTITLDLCQKLIDHFIVVTEEDIKHAIIFMLKQHHMIIEGAAGVTVAAYLKEKERFHDKNVVLIICGRNIGLGTLKQIICEQEHPKLNRA